MPTQNFLHRRYNAKLMNVQIFYFEITVYKVLFWCSNQIVSNINDFLEPRTVSKFPMLRKNLDRSKSSYLCLAKYQRCIGTTYNSTLAAMIRKNSSLTKGWLIMISQASTICNILWSSCFAWRRLESYARPMLNGL